MVPINPPAGVHQLSFTLSAPSLHQTTAVIKQSVINSSTSVESLEKEAISAISFNDTNVFTLVFANARHKGKNYLGRNHI